MKWRRPISSMRGITKRFPGVVALRRADLDAYAGEAVALMGANGAGKSTLMNILGGVIGKDEGEISIGGQSVELRSPIESLDQGIAFVYQELSSLPTMTIAENVFADGLPATLRPSRFCRGRAADRRNPRPAGIQASIRARRSPHLNTGDRQLVEIARALRRNPTDPHLRRADFVALATRAPAPVRGHSRPEAGRASRSSTSPISSTRFSPSASGSR